MEMFPVDQAVLAQKALREAAGLGLELFPIQAFIGMISDEIEKLREQGRSDKEIATIIEQSSRIKITASEIAENYASADERRGQQ